MEIFN